MNYLVLTGLCAPILGILIVFCVKQANWGRLFALLSSLISAAAIAIAFYKILDLKSGSAGFQIPLEWAMFSDAKFYLALTPNNGFFALAVSLVYPFFILNEWNRYPWKIGFFGCVLTAQFSSLGLFLSQNLIFSSVFFILGILPTIFLLGIWREEVPNRIQSTDLFLNRQIVSMALLLLAVFILFSCQSPNSFDLSLLSRGDWQHSFFEMGSFRMSSLEVIFVLVWGSVFLRAGLFPIDFGLKTAASELPSVLSALLLIQAFVPSIWIIDMFYVQVFKEPWQSANLFLQFVLFGNVFVQLVRMMTSKEPRAIIFYYGSMMSAFLLILFTTKTVDLSVAGVLGVVVLTTVVSGLSFYVRTISKDAVDPAQSWRAVLARAPRLAILGGLLFGSAAFLPGSVSFHFAKYVLTGLLDTHVSFLILALACLTGIVLTFSKVYSLWHFGSEEKLSATGKLSLSRREWLAVGTVPVIALALGLGLVPWVVELKDYLKQWMSVH